MLAACEMSGRVRDAFAARNWEAWSADLLPSETPVELLLTTEGKGGRVRRRPNAWEPVVPGTRHYQGDVRDLFSPWHPVNEERRKRTQQLWPLWDLVIAFPPCTHLSLAGARYWKQKQADGRQAAGAAFFLEMTQAPAPHVAVENPVGIMGRKEAPLYRVPDQVVQPWMFGDPLVKKTCLWLKGLPLLEATHQASDYPELQRVATGGGSYRVDIAAGRGPNNQHEDGEGRARRAILRSLTPQGLANQMAAQWGRYIEKEETA
jgi:site-specific DNA-cytosine methylase